MFRSNKHRLIKWCSVELECYLKHWAERAFQQIKTKQYATEVGYGDVALMGIAFCGKAIKIIHQQ